MIRSMKDARPAPTYQMDVTRKPTYRVAAAEQPIKWNRNLRLFLHCLVDKGMKVDDAAKEADVRLKRARLIVAHPEFIKAYDARLDVVRANEKARNIHKAIAIRDDEDLFTPAGRKVQLEAAKFLHGEGDSKGKMQIGVSVSLGYVIDISGDKAPPVRTIDIGDNVQFADDDD